MYDLVEACLLEASDIRYRATHNKLAHRLDAGTASLRKSVQKSATTGGDTRPGAYIGDSARKLSKFISSLPIVTLTPDAIRHAYCVDLLTDRWKSDRSNPTAAVQLAESLIAAQQTQALIRFAQAVDPASYILGSSVRVVSKAGRANQLSTPSKLARMSHRAIMAAGGPNTIEQNLALARAYRIAGKPGLATRYASLAGVQATQLLNSLENKAAPSLPDRLSTAFASQGWWAAARELGKSSKSAVDILDNATNRWEASYTGDCELIDLPTRARMQKGEAWTIIGWSMRDAENSSQARAAANAALAAKFTVGNEVLAALINPSDGTLAQRINQRVDLLVQINRADRTFYRGRWRGSIWIASSVLAEQARKASRLLE